MATNFIAIEILDIDDDLFGRLSSDYIPSDIKSDILKNKIENGLLDNQEWDEIKRCVWQLENFIKLSQNGKQIFLAEEDKNNDVYNLLAPVAHNLYQLHTPLRDPINRYQNNPYFRVN
jgi:hypothetical protein